jgi:SHS2 domain-containing protein
MPFRFRDDLSKADIAFQAQGESREELFRAAWQALLEVMLDNSNKLKKKIEKKIRLEHESLDMLLLSFLNEELFYKDAEGLFLRVEEINITESPGACRLTARLKGAYIDRRRHKLGIDVKGITLHEFQIKRTPGGFLATVVVDI